MEQMKVQFLCTRPTLAAILQKHGHKAVEAANPWKPERSAWLFDIDADLAEIVSDYYTERGQTPPAAIRKAVRE